MTKLCYRKCNTTKTSAKAQHFTVGSHSHDCTLATGKILGSPTQGRMP